MCFLPSTLLPEDGRSSQSSVGDPWSPFSDTSGNRGRESRVGSLPQRGCPKSSHCQSVRLVVHRWGGWKAAGVGSCRHCSGPWWNQGHSNLWSQTRTLTISRTTGEQGPSLETGSRRGGEMTPREVPFHLCVTTSTHEHLRWGEEQENS